jgi:hypothetical protein
VIDPLILKGQTFFRNTTFTYQALQSFSYANDQLANCELESGTARVGVYGPPLGAPRVEWELSSEHIQQ